MNSAPFENRSRRWSLTLLVILACSGPTVARARTYTLPELLDLAHNSNPGLVAGHQATAGIEAQLSEAHRSWLPTGDFTTILGPSPEVQCETDRTPTGEEANLSPKAFREKHCDWTNVSDVRLKFNGIITRSQINIIQPVYTFGKISAGVKAAEEGVKASKGREAGLQAELDLNIRKAYWGFKLAREIYNTLKDGVGYLDSALKTIDKELADGSGNSTLADRYRLRLAHNDVDVRILEAAKLQQLARNGLRALIGPDAPSDLDVDGRALGQLDIPPRTLGQYLDQARLSRPEVAALDHLANSRRSLADFEWRKQLPDLVLMGSATFAYASSVDNPQNAFANDPFNTVSAGVVAALRMPLDFGVRNARAKRVRAEAEESYARRREALGGITFEVERAYGDLTEALERGKVLQKGEKDGKRWISKVAQDIAIGLAESRDVADALRAYFEARLRYMQSMHDVNVAAASLARATGGDVAKDELPPENATE